MSSDPRVGDGKESTQSSKLYADLGRRLAEMKENGLMCDVNIAGLHNENPAEYISAHSLVLASSSDMFFQLFVAEKDHLLESITRIAVEMSVLKTVVDFIYGVIPTTEDGIIALRKGAQYLGNKSTETYVQGLTTTSNTK